MGQSQGQRFSAQRVCLNICRIGDAVGWSVALRRCAVVTHEEHQSVGERMVQPEAVGLLILSKRISSCKLRNPGCGRVAVEAR